MNGQIPGIRELICYLEDTGITTCILYGSAASNRIRAESDIDIAIAGNAPLTPEKLLNCYLKAVELLKREVDISDLRLAHGLFMKEILTGGEILLNKDPVFLGRKAIEMMDYQTDLAPGVNAMLKKRLELAIRGK